MSQNDGLSSKSPFVVEMCSELKQQAINRNEEDLNICEIVNDIRVDALK